MQFKLKLALIPLLSVWLQSASATPGPSTAGEPRCETGKEMIKNAQPGTLPVWRCRAKVECDYRARRDALPPDATELIARQEQCDHFSGELNGDNSARDQQVKGQMASLRCDGLESNTLSLVKQLWENRPAAESVLFLFERYRKAFEACEVKK